MSEVQYNPDEPNRGQLIVKAVMTSRVTRARIADPISTPAKIVFSNLPGLVLGEFSN